jgi:hypothetical protein
MSDPRKTVRLQVQDDINTVERDGVLYKAWKHDGFYFCVRKGVIPHVDEKGFRPKIVYSIDDSEYQVDVPQPPAGFYQRIEKRHDNFHGVIGVLGLFVFPTVAAFWIVENGNLAPKWIEFLVVLFSYGFLYFICAERYKKWLSDRLERKKRRAFKKWKAEHELIFVP